MKNIIITLAAATVLVACGGGESNESTSPPPVDNPTFNARYAKYLGTWSACSTTSFTSERTIITIARSGSGQFLDSNTKVEHYTTPNCSGSLIFSYSENWIGRLPEPTENLDIVNYPTNGTTSRQAVDNLEKSYAKQAPIFKGDRSIKGDEVCSKSIPDICYPAEIPKSSEFELVFISGNNLVLVNGPTDIGYVPSLVLIKK